MVSHAVKVARLSPFISRVSKIILVVDDDAAVRRFITRLLASGGYGALQCESVREAIAVVASLDVTFDTVLTDLVMPDGDGAEIAAHVARCRPSTPVIFMSGYALADLHPDERPSEGACFLQKPFSRDALIQAISAAHVQAAA